MNKPRFSEIVKEKRKAERRHKLKMILILSVPALLGIAVVVTVALLIIN